MAACAWHLHLFPGKHLKGDESRVQPSSVLKKCLSCLALPCRHSFRAFWWVESEHQLGPQNRDTALVKAMGFFVRIVVFSDLDTGLALEAVLLLNSPTGFGRVNVCPRFQACERDKTIPRCQWGCCCWTPPDLCVCQACRAFHTSSAVWITQDLHRKQWHTLELSFRLNCETFPTLAIVRKKLYDFL